MFTAVGVRIIKTPVRAPLANADRSAAELTAELPYLGVAQGEAKVRQVLRDGGPFTEVWRGGGKPGTHGDCPQFIPLRNCFSKLKQFRAVATRDYMYQATVDVASIRIWLRDPSHDLQP